MKKSVLIVIGIIFIFSVLIVNFFGLNQDTFEETIYVTSIEIDNENAKKVRDNDETIILISFEFDELDQTNNIIQIDYHVYPENATNQDVRFIYDTEQSYASVDSFGRVIFYESGETLTLSVVATDNSSVSSQRIKVVAKTPKN